MFLAEQTVWVLTFQMNLTPKATIHSEIPFAHRAEVIYGYTLTGGGRNALIWATGPGGVLVFSPKGKHLGTILTGQRTANCTFGDDGSTLYMTADMYLMRIRTSIKGNGF